MLGYLVVKLNETIFLNVATLLCNNLSKVRSNYVTKQKYFAFIGFLQQIRAIKENFNTISVRNFDSLGVIICGVFYTTKLREKY